MKKIAFIFIGITSLLAYFIGSMFIDEISSNSFMRFILWLIHLAMFSIVFLGPFISRVKPNADGSKRYQLFQLLSYQLMGFYLILLFLLILKSLMANFLLKMGFGNSQFLSSATILLSFVLTILGFYSTKKKPTIVRVKIKIKNLKKELIGFKIVQLSDVHVSQTIKRDFVETIVNISNNELPDLVALTGDFIDGNINELKNDLEPFKDLKSTYGSFYCPGNHEYYWGFENWMGEFRALNFNVLLNESRVIKVGDSTMAVGGVHDLASHRIDSKYSCDPDLAFAKTFDSDFLLLLAHQPKSVHKIKKTKVDLVLSGHTHAGQFFPGSLFIFLFQPYVKGLHIIKGINLYINQGTGYWGPPNRLGTKSEITVIELE